MEQSIYCILFYFSLAMSKRLWSQLKQQNAEMRILGDQAMHVLHHHHYHQCLHHHRHYRRGLYRRHCRRQI